MLNNPLFPTYLWNGLKLAVIGAFGAMLFATPAAYALSRFRFASRNVWMIGLLALPDDLAAGHHGAALSLHGPDRPDREPFRRGLIYIAIAAPLFTWMLKGFLDTIPQSLEDAAMIDGCTRFGAFMRVVLPLSLPGLTSAFVLNAILGWSQFIIPFILLSKPALLPISVGIFNFQGTYSQTSTQILAAASVLSIVPAVIVFLALQRFIIGALMAGAVKG